MNGTRPIGGPPWHETVLYELHTGAFSPEGTFDGVRRAARPSGRDSA